MRGTAIGKYARIRIDISAWLFRLSMKCFPKATYKWPQHFDYVIDNEFRKKFDPILSRFDTEFVDKFGVTRHDFRLSAEAGQRLAAVGGGNTAFSRILFNHVVNIAKENNQTQQIFESIIDELKWRMGTE